MSVFKFGTLKSPPRRPTVQGSAQSPFCTSPSQLQEVSWDPVSSGNGAVPFTPGLQSPGKTSPIRGRTVKEYEDQLTQLKKENFNLKLRIYFLDERMGQMNLKRVDDKDDHAKEDHGLKVTCESLQKELSIKQDLVIQASKAIDVLEEQYRSELKKSKEERDREKSIFDSHIQELENELKMLKDQAKEQTFLNLKSTGGIHSQEETEQLKQQIADLTSQVETMKLQQKRRSDSSREKLDDDLLPLQRESYSMQAATAEEKSSPGEKTCLNSDVSLKEKQLNTMEEGKKDDPLNYKAMQLKIKDLELQLTEATNKLHEVEELLKKQGCQFNQVNQERIKGYLAIKGFIKKNKDLSCELEKLELEMKEKDQRIHDLTSELKELRDAYNKANWEACQLQAQACLQGSCGKPGTVEDVRDMTEDENERLWAELEDKKKKLAELTTQRDNLSTEMAKQAQNLAAALQDKEFNLKECEMTNAALSSELENRDKHVKELNEELIEVKKNLKNIEKSLQENSRAETQDKKDSKEKQEKIKNLEVELEDKKKEVEHLKIEIRKRNSSLQELLNKELRDKNKEIERLDECGRKREMEVMLLKQKLEARGFQLQLLQRRVTELGTQVSLPGSCVLRVRQQPQQVGTYFAQHMQMAGDSENNLRDQLQASWEDRMYLCEKVEELQQQLRNTPERDGDSRALRTECTRLQETLQKADSWRRDATEICSKLTQRLEELSMFLAALLRHPEQLNGLSVNRRLIVSQAVERSMEMSHSLSVTLSATNLEFSETTMPLLNDSVSSIIMASDLNISELFKESSELAGNNEENLAFEMHVEGNNDIQNVCYQVVRDCQHLQAEEQEVKQDNQKEMLQKIVNKISPASADLVQESETESNSFSVMTFYSSGFDGDSLLSEAKGPVSNKISPASADLVQESETESNSSCLTTFYSSGFDGHSLLSEAKGPVRNPASHNDVIESPYPFTAFCESLKLEEMQPKCSRPAPGSDIIELSNRPTASCQTFTPPKLLAPKKGRKVACVNKVRRSSSASTVILRQVAPAVSKKEQDVTGSLSDSEAWSEPDRSVSLARIGLSEEGTNIVVSPGANNNMDVGASYCRKILQMEDNSSDSSEETAREIIRNPGKRTRSEATEIRRLQNRLETMENLNEVLKVELNLVHLLLPHANKYVLVCNQNMSAVNTVGMDNSANALKSPSKDVDTNTNESVSINESETKEGKHKMELEEKSTTTSPVMNKSNMEHSASTEIPLDLLDQIKFQREKLESLHDLNDLIRHHLEKAFLTLSSSKEDNFTSESSRLIREAVHRLEELYHKCLRQKYHIKELNLQLEQSLKQTKLANEELQVTQNTVRGFQERVNNLEALLKEQESKLSDQQCLMNEIDDACKEKRLELEKVLQEMRKLEEGHTKQLQEIWKLKKESDSKLQDALRIQEDSKIKLAKMQIELSDSKMMVERELVEKAAIQIERESHAKEFKRKLLLMSEHKDSLEHENIEVKRRIQKAEHKMLEAERKLTEMQQMSAKFKEECRTRVEVTIEKEKRELENQMKLKVYEAKHKLENRYRKEIQAKIRFYEGKIRQQENEIRSQAEDKIKALNKGHKKIVIDLKKEIQERERSIHAKELELIKKLDEAILSNSKINLEKTRVANEKLHLEKELRKQEALKSDLIHEKKEVENSLSAMKEKMEKQMSSILELNKDKGRLEAAVKDLEVINDELMKRLCASHSGYLHVGSHGDTISGNESAPTTLSTASPRSFSSGLEGSSTGPVSLETNISLGDDQNTLGPASLSTSTLTLPKGIARQRSEPSDNMSDDHPLRSNLSALSQVIKSEMDIIPAWVGEQRSAPSISNARNITSPDLGIESDQGRLSSLEASSSGPLEIHQSEADVSNTKDGNGAKDYKQLETENIVLKQKFYKTLQYLHNVAVQLKRANERREKVEQAIFRQLHRTHHVLTQTRVNLEANAKECEESPK